MATEAQIRKVYHNPAPTTSRGFRRKARRIEAQIAKAVEQGSSKTADDLRAKRDAILRIDTRMKEKDCRGNFPTIHLYTTQSLTYDSVRSLDRMLDRVRQDCWCKFHAHKYYQPTN